MLGILKRYIKRLILLRELIAVYFSDCYQYAKYSATFNTELNQSRRKARIIRLCHGIEKGLSLPAPRPGFGRSKVIELMRLTSEYGKAHGPDDVYSVACETINEYCEFNSHHGWNDSQIDALLEKLTDTISLVENRLGQSAGIIELSRDHIQAEVGKSYSQLVRSRHSVRQFSGEPVSMDVIENATALAIRAPSVCNRQCWKVHLFQDTNVCQRLLNIQQGGKGFEHLVTTILVVAADLNVFWPVRERRQPYIDGGMFGMSLVTALHSFGLGTCCMNLALTPRRERRFRQEANISPNQALIFMIAVGHLPERFIVAASPRWSLESYIVRHDNS